MDVVVVGSLNRDISVVTPHPPRPGETVIGIDHFFGPGGKGANQAVAAARLGADVAMIGRVGADVTGSVLVDGLERDGVDVSRVGVDDEAPTGIAVITIDQNAENSIVVSPGANMRLTPHHLDVTVLASAAVVLAQLEVPIETVETAAAATEGTFILNPAPAADLSADLLDRVDVLVPNRTELGHLVGVHEIRAPQEAVAAVQRLDSLSTVVVTLGSDGALLVDDGQVEFVPALAVQAVDTTGAGDAFCGALAQSLSTGTAIDDAVRRAVAASAIAVTRRGAQDAMPTVDELEAMLSR